MKHPVYDTDKHFTIDLTTRTLISEMKKISLVKHTHNSERFTFQFPRTVEGHDLSLCDKAEVHFLNIDSVTKETSKGTYAIEDVQMDAEDSEKITFSWLIDGRASEYVGTLHFSIHFKCEENGKLLYKWPTATFTGILISDGVDNGEMEMQEYNDIVTAWMHEIEANIDNTVKDAVQGIVEENIEESVDEAVNAIIGPKVDAAIEEALKDSAIYPANYAPAIVEKVNGSSLTLKDISPLATSIEVLTGGYITESDRTNILRFDKRADGKAGYSLAAAGATDTKSGISATVNADGSVVLNGTATANATFYLNERDPNGPGEFSADSYHTAVLLGGVSGVTLRAQRYYQENGVKGEDYLNAAGSGGASALLPSGTIGVSVYLLVYSGNKFNNVTLYPMVVKGQNVELTEYIAPIGASGSTGNITVSAASLEAPDVIVEQKTVASGETAIFSAISSGMIITTDNDGAIISAEYAKDTNKVIEELSQRIGEGGGGDLTEAAKEEVRAYVDEAILGGAW